MAKGTIWSKVVNEYHKVKGIQKVHKVPRYPKGTGEGNTYSHAHMHTYKQTDIHINNMILVSKYKCVRGNAGVLKYREKYMTPCS